MDKIDRLISLEGMNSILVKLHLFRKKYRIHEAALWDLITIQQYESAHSAGMSLYQLAMKTYGNKSCYRVQRTRCALLVKKGLIINDKGRMRISESFRPEMLELLTLFFKDFTQTVFYPDYIPFKKSYRKAILKDPTKE